MALTTGRLGGNLSKVGWAPTGTDQIEVAEGFDWRFLPRFGIEETTPLATDSPRADVLMRDLTMVEVSIWVTGTGGVPRLPALALRNTGATLTLYPDKNDLTYHWSGTAKIVGFRWGGTAPGGRKQRAIYTFVFDGALTWTSNGSGTTIA